MSPFRDLPPLVALLASFAVAQNPRPYLSDLHATKDSPLFTTYAAALERSEFTLDEAYHFRYYDSTSGADFTSERGGDICLAFELGSRFVYCIRDMARQPVITTSYSDVVRFTEFPFDNVRLDATFLVRSSRVALYDLRITNVGPDSVSVACIPFLRKPRQPFAWVQFRENWASFVHEESPDEWMVGHKIPFLTKIQNVVLGPDGCSGEPDMGRGIGGVLSLNAWSRGGNSLVRPPISHSDSAGIIAFPKRLNLGAGKSTSVRLIRVVGPLEAKIQSLVADARALLQEDPESYIAADEKLYSSIPVTRFSDSDLTMLYWSSFSLMRGVMLPPEGNCHFNYYVFSREPRWGWGHGGQVFHESLSMLAYALMDPQSAMESQRVFMERQMPDGYINYRTGPYLDENIPYRGGLTTSAPWFAWENREISRLSQDRKFLGESYASSARFYHWVVRNRDMDGDGLCEWGGHAVLESVRDGLVAVWDQVGWPSNFEALDLNCMLVSEARALAAMATQLGLDSEARAWKSDADSRSEKINARMWDDKTGFYYHIDRKSHTFSFAKRYDLKRQEIVGFLPLWSGVADSTRAAKLVAHLTDTSKFWRPFGVPSLAADDPYFDPKGYWNGPVWVEWNYLITRGLQRYGYRQLAIDLTHRIATTMIAELKKTHTMWELYSPDQQWAGHHQTYIWAGIIARMLLDIEETRNHLEE